MKKILGISIAALMVFLVSGDAMAASAGNWMTRNGSHANSIAVDGVSAVFMNGNSATLMNDSLTLANSGFNFSRGRVVSGGAEGDVDMTNNANSNTLTGGVTHDGTAMAGNAWTENHSTANAAAFDMVSLGVVNLNGAYGFNFSVGVVNSGLNFAWGPGASIRTGNASMDVTEGNTLNTNDTHIRMAVTGNAMAGNMGTKNGSHTNAMAISGTEVGVFNVNKAMGMNISLSVVNTGGNFVFGRGNVNTGDADVTTIADNHLNSNTTSVVGTMGGNAMAGNLGTTNGSTANSLAYAGNSVGVMNLNGATGTNFVFSVANSGVNYSARGGTVRSGDVEVITNASNTANTNETRIVGTGAGNAMAGNVGTRNGSHTNAAAVSESSTTVVNLNGADEDNTVIAVANSGLNGATGGGTVVSGDAKINTDVANTANTNTTTVATSGAGDAVAVNAATENGSTANATAVSSANTTVVNDNTAVETNTVVAVSNTGGNSAGGSVTSGDASVTTSAGNTANTNTTSFSL